MSDELNSRNFKRISLINWLISGPLLILFAWPYLIIAGSIGIHELIIVAGSLLFAIPFSLTIIHGHISVAVGPLHRDSYYYWQQNRKGLLKWAFHPELFRTRIRLGMIFSSLAFLLIGVLIK